MNLERSEDERRFETQQIEAARLDGGGPSPNPFAAALGLAGIVAIVALMFLFWSIFEILFGIVCYGVGLASFLFNMARSVPSPAVAVFEPCGKVLIALTGAIIAIFACRSLPLVCSAIAVFARKDRR